ISNLVIDQSVSNMGSRGLNFTPGSYIDKVSISGFHFKGTGIGGTSVDLQSLEARTFTLSGSSVDSANNTIISNGANIGNLVLRDNFGASNNGISLINSTIDTLHIYGSYFKTQGLAFTADAPSSIGQINTGMYVQNDASDNSSIVPLKYMKNGVLHDVKPRAVQSIASFYVDQTNDGEVYSSMIPSGMLSRNGDMVKATYSGLADVGTTNPSISIVFAGQEIGSFSGSDFPSSST